MLPRCPFTEEQIGLLDYLHWVQSADIRKGNYWASVSIWNCKCSPQHFSARHAQLFIAARGGELGGIALAVPLRLLLATKLIIPVITRKIPDLQLRGETGFKVMALNRLPFQSIERFSLPSVYKPGYYKACEHFKSFHWNTRTSAIHILGSKVVQVQAA